MQSIVIESMEFSNILAFGERNLITFTGSPVIILDAPNGSGKSSIATILEEGLYNKNSRGFLKSELLNMYNDATSYSIKIVFTKGDVQYVVDKVVKSTAKLKLTADGTDISANTTSATYKVLEEILGMPFETFSKLVYQGLESNLDFLTQTDAKRRDFLVSMLDLAEYSELEQRFKEERDSINTNIKAVSRTQETISAWLQNTQSMEIIEPKEVPEQIDVSEKLSEIEAGISVAQSELANIKSENSAALAAISANKKTKELIERNTLAIEKAKADLEGIIPKLASDVDFSTLPELSVKLKDTQRKLSELEGQMRDIKAKYTKFKGAADNTECPTCKRPLDVSEAVVAMKAAESDFNSKKPAREALKVELSELETKLTELQKQKDLESTASSLRAKIDLETKKLTELADTLFPETKQIVDSSQVEGELCELRSMKAQLEKEKQENTRLILEIAAYNSTVAANNAKAEAQREKADEYRAALVEATEQLETLYKEVHEWDIIVQSVKPVINYQIESSIKVFEDEINKYLQKTSDGKFFLSFTMKNQKLDVTLYSRGVKRNTKTMSSGEKVKIQIATLMAIRDIQSATGKAGINLIFLDELISALDPQSRDSVVELLLPTSYNTVMVSHGYSHPLAKTVQIDRENEVSKLWLM